MSAMHIVRLLAMADYILTVHPSLPVRTVPDLLALARTNPGTLTFASSGNITGAHLAGELRNALGTLPGFEITQWYAILVPAGAPKDIVARLNKEIAVAMAKPAIVQAYKNLGTEPGASSPEDFAALIRAETAHYARLIKAANIKAA